MFTGIIEEIGKIKSINKSTKGAKISIAAKKVLKDVEIGDSISTNGVCLTVTSFTKTNFTTDVMGETLRKSNLGKLTSGDSVNLERALKLSDRLGGHLVTGHIDCTGNILKVVEEDNAIWLTIALDEKMKKYIIYKGSIAIDGVSLTVANVSDHSFEVSIIPHTKNFTTFLEKGVGDLVNLEYDLIGKYVERLMKVQKDESRESKINMDFLKENGFV